MGVRWPFCVFLILRHTTPFLDMKQGRIFGVSFMKLEKKNRITIFSSFIRALSFCFKPSLTAAYPKQKMNVFGSQILFGYLIHPKIVICQASNVGYRFRVSLQLK